MAVAKHIIRGNAARLLAAQFRFLILGNSIHLPSINYNVTQALFKQAPTPILGNSAGMVFSTGLPVTGSFNGLGMTLTSRRPGEDTSKCHLKQTTFASGDCSSFTPTASLSAVYDAGPGADWLGSRTFRSIFLLESDPSLTGYANWEHKGANRTSPASNTYSLTVGSTITATPSLIRQLTSTAYSAGTGSNALLAFIQSSNQVESGTFRVASGALEVVGESVGVFGGYGGHGSWGLEPHTSATPGVTITADAPAYDPSYSDAALIAELAAYRYNLIILSPGPNETDYPGLKNRIQRVIARVRRCAALAGIPAPYFLLVTQYDALSDDQTSWDTARQACWDIGYTDSAVEVVDFCGWQRDNFGPWSAWRTTQLSDLIHPATANATLRTNWANLIYSQIQKINYSGTPHAPSYAAVKPAWLAR